MIRILSHLDAKNVLVRRAVRLEEAEEAVRPILLAVAQRGDEAAIEFARQFDDWVGSSLRIPEQKLEAAANHLSKEIRHAMEVAIANIREFAKAQLPREYFREFSLGRKLGQIVRPLDAVGCYIPSGRYPLPSTLLMTAVLAQEAGVARIVVTSPKPTNEILGAARLLGLNDVFELGGAQAIAAMAYGTATIPKVDRIVGPGNIYVATAKKLLSSAVGIDFIAGPTVILILAAEGNPEIIAADMLAQAEHDFDACAVLITTSRTLAQSVQRAIEKQLETLPTAGVARRSIDQNGAVILVPDLATGVALTNEFAPEHLTLQDASLLRLIKHAGTIFIGDHSPESAGDYAAGPSHVLPTSGMARLRGGLSTADFVKVIAIQELSQEGLRNLAPAITALARAEGLEAHARAVEVRSVQ
jgi:histidinol dehydrogenase